MIDLSVMWQDVAVVPWCEFSYMKYETVLDSSVSEVTRTAP